MLTILKLFAIAIALWIIAAALLKIVEALRHVGRMIWRLLAVTVLVGASASAAGLFALATAEVFPSLVILNEPASVWAAVMTFSAILGLALVLEQRVASPKMAYSVTAPEVPSLSPLRASEAPARQPTSAHQKKRWIWWSAEARAARSRVIEEARLKDAWDEIEQIADWAPARVALARRSCENFLAAVGDASAGPELMSYSMVLRKRLPEVIESAIRHCAGASHSERHQFIDEALDQLETLAGQAERHRATIHAQAVQSNSTMRRYIEQVVRPEELRL